MRLFLLTWVLLASIWALDVPPLSGRVVDTAHLFTPAQVARLSQKLAAVETNTTHQIAVLTLPDLEDESLEIFAHKVASTWQLGKAKKDNGVLIMIVKQSNDIRIEVGYGLEGELPDGLVGSIIRREMVPHFKQEAYYQGVDAAIAAIEAATRGEYESKPPMSELEIELFFALLGVIFIVLFILSRINKLLASAVGALSGMGVGLFYFDSMLALVVLGVVGAIAGLLAGYFPNDSVGGRSGRGGRGGGGFSGGGGGFGGGGASGKW